MAENSLPTALPTRQAAAIPGRSARNKVTGKLRTALNLMVWSGLRRAEAAEKAGLADSSLRFALRKPHVLQYYNAELAALRTSLRTSLRAKNVHRLDTIADSSKNDMAKVGAIKALEVIADQADERTRPGPALLPGLQIVIVNGTASPRTIGPASLTPLPHQPAE